MEFQQMTLVTFNSDLDQKRKNDFVIEELPPLLNLTEFDHTPTEHKLIVIL